MSVSWTSFAINVYQKDQISLTTTTPPTHTSFGYAEMVMWTKNIINKFSHNMFGAPVAWAESGFTELFLGIWMNI